MTASHQRELLRTGQIAALLIEELGWDHNRQRLDLQVGSEPFRFEALAHKRGMVAWACQDDEIPGRSTRVALGRLIQRTSHEYLAVFSDRSGDQLWQWAGKRGSRRVVREHLMAASHGGTALLQKLQHLSFDLEEEDRLTIADVAYRAQRAFDVDVVTKRFYDRYKREHDSFAKLVSGIEDQGDARWYASLMLNRLMFVFFIQGRGFLDGDRNYLRTRLHQTQALGDVTFHSFYRHFLMRLFHEGLASRNRSAELDELLGDVPYLNGGLFDVHELEERYSSIEIEDEAFEAIFSFFEEFDWHLDARPDATDNEINPDILGYIFEKYINQQLMGAYYTKEDITTFMAAHSICARLLDGSGWGDLPWRLLVEDPRRYLPGGAAFGLERDLPPEIEEGVGDPGRRSLWLGAASEDVGLPEETWRECVARRQHWMQVLEQVRTGEVRNASGAVERNLNLQQLVIDVIALLDDPAEVRGALESVQQLTVLDPTCGSGAFLFAAMTVLEPLYASLLSRLEDLAQVAVTPDSETSRILEQASDGATRRFYVLRSIALNNLYGVDLMAEAVEICKLRLFLKLVSQVETREDLAPLPDIDFNIRAGNALVGYSTFDDVARDMEMHLDTASALPHFEELLRDYDSTLSRFRDRQISQAPEVDAGEEKKWLTALLHEMQFVLDQAAAASHAVNDAGFKAWRESAKPFHWCVGFHQQVVQEGGFDVVLGNPPYVRLNKVEGYTPRGFATLNCGDLYSLVMERGFELAKGDSRIAWIVPVSSLASEGFASLQRALQRYECFSSSYDDRPSKLFVGLEHIRLAIHLIHTGATPAISTSRYHRWRSSERAHLFENLRYTRVERSLVPGSIPKLGGQLDLTILDKLSASRRPLSASVVSAGKHEIFYTRKLGNYVQVLDFVPELRDQSGRRRSPSELKQLRFRSEQESKVALAALNSSLFYWFIRIFSDCRNLNKREIESFPVDIAALSASSDGPNLAELALRLMEDIQRTSEVRKMGSLHVQCTFPGKSKLLIDEIDTALAHALGMTDEELDWIWFLDGKYRIEKSDE